MNTSHPHDSFSRIVHHEGTRRGLTGIEGLHGQSLSQEGRLRAWKELESDLRQSAADKARDVLNRRS